MYIFLAFLWSSGIPYMSDAVALCRTIVTLDALYLDLRYKSEDQQVCELWLWLGERLVLFTTSVFSYESDWTSHKKSHDDGKNFWVEMVLIRLIKADKRLAERIQQKLNFSNYQMLCLSWAIGLVMGIAITILFF